jgi:hypothetical protein
VSARFGEVWVGTTAAIRDLLLGEAVGLSVSSGGFKALPAWLEISLGVSVVSCCSCRRRRWSGCLRSIWVWTVLAAVDQCLVTEWRTSRPRTLVVDVDSVDGERSCS